MVKFYFTNSKLTEKHFLQKNEQETIKFKIQEGQSPPCLHFRCSWALSSTKYENAFSDIYVVVMSNSCCKATIFLYSGDSNKQTNPKIPTIEICFERRSDKNLAKGDLFSTLDFLQRPCSSNCEADEADVSW